MKNLKLIMIGLLTSLSLWITGCDEGKECPDVAYYGPQPCESDEQCALDNDEGWVCDKDYEIGPQGCEDTWPTCVQAKD